MKSTPRMHVRITSRRQRAGGRRAKMGSPKGRPIFQPGTVKLRTNSRGRLTFDIRAMPSNYEMNVQLRKALPANEKLQKEVAELRTQFERIQKEGKGTLVIPPHIPMTMGQSSFLTIGKNYVVLALRSPKVRSYAGFYHTVGGIPFMTKPRKASLKLMRSNVREELRDEAGIQGKKVKLGNPMGVHLTFEHNGMSLNIIQPARVVTSDPGGFIQRHFKLADPRDPAKGYVLRHDTREGWEAAHYVVIPNTPTGLRKFYEQNKERLTPVLAYALRQLIQN